MTGDSELGARIKWHREARGLTQEQLADALGVTARSVRNWERGTHHPQRSVGAIETLFRVSLEESGQDVTDPVLAAIDDAAGLSDASKEILRGTYRNLLRDEELRRQGA